MTGQPQPEGWQQQQQQQQQADQVEQWARAQKGTAWIELHHRWEGKTPPQADRLMAIFTDNYSPYRTPAGDPFAVGRFRATSVALGLKGSGGLRQRLALDYFDIVHSMPSQESLTAVTGMAEGLCAQRGETARQALRVARAPDGNIVLDLGRREGQLVVINGGGWWPVPRAPVLFRRSAATHELPVPVSPPDGNPPEAVWRLVNVRGRDEQALFTACRLASMIPEGTRPVELITGQPGAIKTGTNRVTVDWLGGAMATMPRDPRDWVAMASNAHTLGHDNISSMSADRQDLLCKAASGDDHLARMLYTDADLYGIKFAPLAIVLNGIEVGMLRSDLIRRAVGHYLLKPDAYLGERQIAADWKAAHPAALGWLLDLLVAVLAQMGKVPAPVTDSLVDFAHVLAALDQLWGTSALELWRAGQRELYADLADGDPVALAIRQSVTGYWEGTPKQLLDHLQSDHQLYRPPAPGQEWTPHRLSGKVDRAQAALEALGWKVERPEDTHTHNRRINLQPPGGPGAAEGPLEYPARGDIHKTWNGKPPGRSLPAPGKPDFTGTWDGTRHLYRTRGGQLLPPGWSRTGIHESWNGEGLRGPDGLIYYQQGDGTWKRPG